MMFALGGLKCVTVSMNLAKCIRSFIFFLFFFLLLHQRARSDLHAQIWWAVRTGSKQKLPLKRYACKNVHEEQCLLLKIASSLITINMWCWSDNHQNSICNSALLTR